MKNLISTMDAKEIRKHINGIKVIMKHGVGTEFTVCGNTYNISKLNMFGIAACYLGYAYSARTGTGKVKLPVKIIWKLTEFASTLETDTKNLPESHRKIIEYADRLLTDDGLFGCATHQRKDCLTFDLLGKDVEGFNEQLRLTLHFSVA